MDREEPGTRQGRSPDNDRITCFFMHVNQFFKKMLSLYENEKRMQGVCAK